MANGVIDSEFTDSHTNDGLFYHFEKQKLRNVRVKSPILFSKIADFGR